MKGRTLLSLAIVASMMLAMMPMFVANAQATTIEVRFENGLNEITKTLGSEFDVTIYIRDCPNIDFYGMEIHWDPSVLELQTGTDADVVEGNFMKTYGTTVFVVAWPEIGALPDIGCGFLAGGPAHGEGDMFKIKFRAKGYGDGWIGIWDAMESYLLYGAEYVPFTPVNGTVHVPPPTATPPNAEFTPANGASFTVGTGGIDITLDGSASVDGLDTLPDVHSCPITTWQWDIDMNNDGSIEDTVYGETYVYHFGPVTGTVNVGITLTVTAPDPTPPTAPSYVDHDSEKHVIKLKEYVAWPGPQIDVYTDKGGMEGGDFYDGDWSDAYGPQELVCVYAKVTYNGEPVEYKPVGFEVIDAGGNSIDYRVAFTNSSGIAKVCFRLPWQGSEAELHFGNFTIVGTVDIAGTIVSDDVKFRYGYIVSIDHAELNPESLKKGESMTVEVFLTSISFTSKTVLLTVVAYDNCSVPIDLDKTDGLTVDPDVTHSYGTWTITIPPWAFVGPAKLYINVFTAAPSAGGIPYCPEKAYDYTILPTLP